MWWFSFILDFTKGKRLPFFGNIPYAQTPKGVALFFFLYLLVIITRSAILPQEDASPLSTSSNETLL